MFDKSGGIEYNITRVIVRCTMHLNVNRILHTPGASQDFRFEMDLSDLDFGGMYPVRHAVVVDGRVYNRAGVLHCDLQTETTLHCACDRCAVEFDDFQTIPYSCVLATEKADEENEDIIVLENDTVDLAELARDAFILGMDTKTLCSEDCQGLCPGCGANLNVEPCRCKKQVDPRLAALAKLLEKSE